MMGNTSVPFLSVRNAIRAAYASEVAAVWGSLDQASTAKGATGLPDSAIVGAMLTAADGFALRRDPTERYIAALFRNPDDAEAA